ncbi:MAG: type II toxin-antitoxin system RelB/DinJ family antitoxin, partial [Raoultibacter sp.]
MDAIVTARVPVEIKEQANGVLKNIGATPTELVNAAYQYVLECEALPKARRESKSSERRAPSSALPGT